MSINFEELDYRQTQLGELILRRRRDALLNTEVFEVKLNDDFLMSSLFTVAEIELARLGLTDLDNTELDILVGGLGLGYTANAALEHPRVHTVTIIEALSAVIEWHQQGLVPLGKRLSNDTRCHFIHGDFFRLAGSSQGFDSCSPGKRYHAILLDIDHSPRHLLNPEHGSFYEADGLVKLKVHLYQRGIFAMWSNELPDEGFMKILADVFSTSESRIVRFHNPYQDCEATATIYLARAN